MGITARLKAKPLIVCFLSKQSMAKVILPPPEFEETIRCPRDLMVFVIAGRGR